MHNSAVKVALAPPESPLTDGIIALRVPSRADIDALVEYAERPSGLDVTWLPVVPGAPYERLRWVVEDWIKGWAGLESFNGPALLLTVPDTSRFVGQVGFGSRGSDVVELVYGVAPEQRGRGLATRAVVLATSWLLRDRGVREVELRIGRAHRESQRVAEKAGFRLSGSVRDVVNGTGETFDDLRYVCDLKPLT